MQRGYAEKAQAMWDNAVVKQIWKRRLESALETALEEMPRYIDVAEHFRLSSENTLRFAKIIAALHMRESSFNFTKHLANGDPLSEDTTHAPAHIMRPALPPYSWREAAIKALEHHADGWILNMERYEWRDVANALWFVHAYNGFGYPKAVNTPYLWNGTQHYSFGQFGSDGKYDPHRVDQNLGAAPLLKALEYA